MSEEDTETGNLWWVGVILVLVGAIGQNLGNNIVSIAHNEEHKDNGHSIEENALVPAGDGDVELSLVGKKSDDADATANGDATSGDEKKKSYIEEHLWGVGTTVFVSSSIMCFVAFGFAAQSLLASLESVQFVSNIFFAKFVLKEEITMTMIASTLLIICGNTLVVIFSGHSSLLLNGAEIFDLYATNTPFHVYLGIGGAIVCACEYTWKHYNHSRMKLRTKLWNHSFVEPLCFCVGSAIIGAFAVVNAKNISMMLTSSASTDRSEFNHEQLYLIFFGWIFIVLFWVSRIDLGLDLFPPLFVIPVIQVCFVFFSIACGGLFFREFESFTDTQFIGFFSGVVLILLGVYGLAPDSELDFSGEEGDSDDEMDQVKLAAVPTGDDSSIVSPRRAGRRLSYSVLAVPDIEKTEAEPTPGHSLQKVNSTRARRGSMSHPLAALKEITRVGAKKGEKIEALAPVVRTARRLSRIALDSQGSYKVRSRTSTMLSTDMDAAPIKEGENEDGV
jgi:magnesium transporter